MNKDFAKFFAHKKNYILQVLFVTLLLVSHPKLFAVDISELAGTYSVTVQLPFGEEDGKVEAHLDGKGGVAGVITLFGSDNVFSSGTFDGLSFRFNGKLRYGIISIKYQLEGIYDNGNIQALARTKFGNIKIVGSKDL